MLMRGSLIAVVLLAIVVIIIAWFVALPPAPSQSSSVVDGDTEPQPLLLLIYRDSADVARAAYIYADGAISVAAVDSAIVPAPVLGGLNYSAIDGGARIPNRYMSMLDSLAMIRGRLPEVYDRISEVVIINKSQSEYELLLHTDIISVPIVSSVPISIYNLETALVAASNLSITDLSVADPAAEATHISIRGPTPVVRYDGI